MFERYTEKSRRVIFFARYDASQFGSPNVESEHLLLALLREDKALVERLGTSAVESIRRQIDEHTTRREKISTSVDLPMTMECKRILAYGIEEAERLGHKHIGTQHLLIAMLREEKCFAAELLRERGVDLDTARKEFQRPPASLKASTVRRKIAPVAFARFSEKAMRAVCFSIQEAVELGSPTIEIEHLLLGILRDDCTEVELEEIRRRVERYTPQTSSLVLSRNCEGAVAFASHESERLGAEKVDMGHLLLGILYEEGSLAAEILKERGVTRSGVLKELENS